MPSPSYVSGPSTELKRWWVTGRGGGSSALTLAALAPTARATNPSTIAMMRQLRVFIASLLGAVFIAWVQGDRIVPVTSAIAPDLLRVFFRLVPFR